VYFLIFLKFFKKSVSREEREYIFRMDYIAPLISHFFISAVCNMF